MRIRRNFTLSPLIDKELAEYSRKTGLSKSRILELSFRKWKKLSRDFI